MNKRFKKNLFWKKKLGLLMCITFIFLYQVICDVIICSHYCPLHFSGLFSIAFLWAVFPELPCVLVCNISEDLLEEYGRNEIKQYSGPQQTNWLLALERPFHVFLKFRASCRLSYMLERGDSVKVYSAGCNLQPHQ